MKPKRIAAIILLLMMFVLPLYVVLGAPQFWKDLPVPTWKTLQNHTYMEQLNNYVSGQFAQNRTLTGMQSTLKYYTGVREENGIFIGDNKLIKNLEEPEEEKLEANISAVNQLASARSGDVFLVLIPTSVVINQEEIPQYATNVNQRDIIDRVYNQVGEMPGPLTPILPFLRSARSICIIAPMTG